MIYGWSGSFPFVSCMIHHEIPHFREIKRNLLFLHVLITVSDVNQNQENAKKKHEKPKPKLKSKQE